MEAPEQKKLNREAEAEVLLDKAIAMAGEIGLSIIQPTKERTEIALMSAVLFVKLEEAGVLAGGDFSKLDHDTKCGLIAHEQALIAKMKKNGMRGLNGLPKLPFSTSTH